MGWIYLAESGASPLPWHPGSGRSPIVRSTHTARLFCSMGKRTAVSRSRRSGMTSFLFQLRTLSGQWTSSTVVSLARISLLRALKRDWKVAEAGFSLGSSTSSAQFDPASFSWKMSQLSFPWGSNELDWSSLRWGTIVDGQLFQPANLVPRICAKDGGFVPTPTARDYRSPGVSRTRKANVEERRGIPLSVWFKVTFGKNLHPSFLEWMMGYPLKHTALGPWAMPWYHTLRAKPSKD